MDILQYFHRVHYHEHKISHCSFGHLLKHCSCGKHSISTNTVATNDKVLNFSEPCPDGGYHIESGKEDKDKSFILGASKLEGSGD
jgi:hypothetical protein